VVANPEKGGNSQTHFLWPGTSVNHAEASRLVPLFSPHGDKFWDFTGTESVWLDDCCESTSSRCFYCSSTDGKARPAARRAAWQEPGGGWVWWESGWTATAATGQVAGVLLRCGIGCDSRSIDGHDLNVVSVPEAAKPPRGGPRGRRPRGYRRWRNRTLLLSAAMQSSAVDRWYNCSTSGIGGER
jgi:hypothetical protein